ncbi:MAG: hypothetical protein FJ083_09960 [Cyanobacteria bacterium K_Offshore_surface_m2_239]|nr:hypothetical protein [Cyanobacteria bacterium K_Offshore_surface_m2_239]
MAGRADPAATLPRTEAASLFLVEYQRHLDSRSGDRANASEFVKAMKAIAPVNLHKDPPASINAPSRARAL